MKSPLAACDDDATVQALRLELAQQITQFVLRSGDTQAVAARRLGIHQPTLSLIFRGQIRNLSLELLLRITVRARLPLTLLTGTTPEEAAVYRTIPDTRQSLSGRSTIADTARRARAASEARRTPEQRLVAFVNHNILIAEFRRSARRALASVPPALA